MRVNVNAPLFPIWPSDSHLSETVRPEYLAVARLEPVFTRRVEGAFGLDVVFANGNGIAVVPGIRVAHEMLVEPEKSALLWPAEIVRAIDARMLAQIEAVLTRRLVAHTLAREVNAEVVFWFGETLDRSEFEAARAAGFAGAASYSSVAVSTSPYVYAQRFARGAGIAICDPSGATGAALLSRTARSVRADLGSAEKNALAGRWFARDIFGPVQEHCEIGINTPGSAVEFAFDRSSGTAVSVATPVPTELMVSFDPQDSPIARTFSVHCKTRAVTRVSQIVPSAAAGGSSGKILLLLPGDSVRDKYADADDAQELGRRLDAEGFTVQIATSSQAGDTAQYDLIHAFGLQYAREYLPIFERARARGIPIVTTAALAKNAGQAEWGSRIAPVVMSRYQDEQTRNAHLKLLSVRRLGDAGADPAQTEPFPGYGDTVRAALRFTGALVTTGSEEEDFARSHFGFTGQVFHAPAYVAAGADVSFIDEIAGSGDFVLSHAPIHPISNQGFLAAAARSAGLRLILAGPVADSHYFGLLREELDSSVVLWPNPSSAQVQALYRQARVFADTAWAQRSLHRAALAAGSGCALVVPAESYAAKLFPAAGTCDVAVPSSIRAALEAAWAGSPAALPGGLEAAFHKTVQAYAQAQTVPAHA